MELKVEVGFDELLAAVKQLPDTQLKILKEEISKTEKKPIGRTAFQEFLMNGPVMTDEHYEIFKDTRKRLNKWRSK